MNRLIAAAVAVALIGCGTTPAYAGNRPAPVHPSSVKSLAHPPAQPGAKRAPVKPVSVKPAPRHHAATTTRRTVQHMPILETPGAREALAVFS